MMFADPWVIVWTCHTVVQFSQEWWETVITPQKKKLILFYFNLFIFYFKNHHHNKSHQCHTYTDLRADSSPPQRFLITVCLYLNHWGLLCYVFFFKVLKQVRSFFFLHILSCLNATLSVSCSCCLDWFCQRKQSAKMTHLGAFGGV